MTRDPTGVLFFEKAGRALASAQVLLAAKHAEGACNRAYYAMFDAAHAALFALGIEEIKAPIKTHNGLVGKFGQHLVKGGYLAATHGEALNAVQLIDAAASVLSVLSYIFTQSSVDAGLVARFVCGVGSKPVNDIGIKA